MEFQFLRGNIYNIEPAQLFPGIMSGCTTDTLRLSVYFSILHDRRQYQSNQAAYAFLKFSIKKS